MTSSALDLTRLSEPVQVRNYLGGQMLTLPWSYGSGDLLELYVEQRTVDVVAISDRCMTAFHLGDVPGLDLGTGVAAASWQAVLATAPLPPDIEAGEWEISTAIDAARIDEGLRAVTEMCLRADGLRFLAKGPTRRSFRQRVVQIAGEVAAAVVQDREVRLQSGGNRKVTLEATRTDGSKVLVQAMTDSDRTSQCDHAYFLADQKAEQTTLIGALQGSRDQWEQQSLGALESKMTLADEKGLPAALSAA